MQSESGAIEIKGSGHLAKELSRITESSRVLLGFEGGAVITITAEGNIGTLAGRFIGVRWMEVVCDPATPVQQLLMGQTVVLGIFQTWDDRDAQNAIHAVTATEISPDYLTPRGQAILAALQQKRVNRKPIVLPSICGGVFTVTEYVARHVSRLTMEETQRLVGQINHPRLAEGKKVWFEIPIGVYALQLIRIRTRKWVLLATNKKPATFSWIANRSAGYNEIVVRED